MRCSTSSTCLNKVWNESSAWAEGEGEGEEEVVEVELKVAVEASGLADALS